MEKKQLILKTLLLLFGILFQPSAQLVMAQKPLFVWADSHGTGRQNYVYFRNDFSLETIPEKAGINIFADSRYHLFVNGNFINFGPVRFYPEHPEYDTYEISSYLKPGKNVIAVKVLSNGINTYQIPKSIGGFIAWGKINNKISFKTPGNWRFKQATGYEESSPKVSFALGVMEVFDERKAVKNWQKPDIDLADWHKVIKIKKQEHWGELQPRTIPHLTQDEIIPKSLLGAYTLQNDENIHSFRIKTPDLLRSQFNDNPRLFAYTYIYSPKDQDVEVGLFWGEHFLNGKQVKREPKLPCRPVRNDALLKLKKGWNFFFVKYDIVWALWDFHINIPKSAEVILSANKDRNSKVEFKLAGPYYNKEREIINNLKLPLQSPDELPDKLKQGWRDYKVPEIPANPAWLMALKYFDKQVEMHPSKVQNFTAKQNTAYVFDMGGKQLGRIFIEYQAPEGTVVDLGFAEDLCQNNKINILKREGIFTAVRHISSGGRQYFETFKPYGLRYLQLNIYNTGGKPIKIKRIGVHRQIYPFKKTGSFSCSDPMFNAIWELGWRSLLVCSEDTYTDTPFRERGLYAGDALPEFAITLVTSGDPRLVKRSLMVFQDMYAHLFYPDGEADEGAVGLIEDFPLITLEYFRWYIDWTSDLKFAKKYFQAYQYLVDNYINNRNKNGLVFTNRVFIEWSEIEKSEMYSTAFHALLARSCENLAHIAKKLHKPDDVRRYSSVSKELAVAINTHFWDDEKGAYRDGIKNGKNINVYHPISSAWVSLFGYTNAAQEKKLQLFFTKKLEDIGSRDRHRQATPYGGFYQTGALYRNGNAALAEFFMRKYWTPMILDGDDTAWENFGNSPNTQGTLSHAWSGNPTYYLSSQTLGVQMGFPYRTSYDTVYIKPQAENINWARGEVPHPKGIVKVDWQVKGDILFVRCETPDGVPFVVQPRGRLADFRLFVNGKPHK